MPPHRRALIREGHVITDGKGAWSNIGLQQTKRMSSSVCTDSVKCNWHLGIDDRYPENTKQRYKFPYGDFKNVHRCGLLAAKSQKLANMATPKSENAAAELERGLKSKPQINADVH